MVTAKALRRRSLWYTSKVIRLLTMVLATSLIAFAPGESTAGKKKARGKLKIESTVDGARVELNGLKAGQTPLKALRVKAGKYTVKVSRIGHLDFEIKVVVKAGRLAEVMADLLPVAGILDVRVKPHGAMVFVDGQLVGKSPSLFELKLGKRSIEINSNGYLSLRKELHAVPGEWVVLKERLELGYEDPLAGELALVALEKSPVDPLADELALVPLAKPAKENSLDIDDPLALEPLLPLVSLSKRPQANRLEPLDVSTRIADRTQWYENWWVWGSAGAVLVSSAVVTAVVLTGGGSEVEVDALLDLSESTPVSW
jgi:hypothetical protein